MIDSSPPASAGSAPGNPEPPARPAPVEAEFVVEVVAPPPAPPAPDYDERGVPSFEHVRERIESRYATAQGSTWLADGTQAARTAEEQLAERERAGAAKLEEIRRSLRGQ